MQERPELEEEMRFTVLFQFQLWGTFHVLRNILGANDNSKKEAKVSCFAYVQAANGLIYLVILVKQTAFTKVSIAGLNAVFLPDYSNIW